MHRAIERFSSVASNLVVFAYLIGLFLGTANYFAGSAIGFDPAVILTVAFVLAGAVEVHAFLAQRHMRASWQERNKLDRNTPEWDAANNRYWINLWIMFGLMAFSVMNGTAFWSLSMHPHTFADWLPVFVRGLIVPSALFVAGFLVALEHDASAMLKATARVMLLRTMKYTRIQWSRRLDKARRAGLNLAPVAVALLEDVHESAAAKQIRTIDDALTRAEGGEPASYGPVPANGYEPLPEPVTPYPPYRSDLGDSERFLLEETGPQVAVKSATRTPSRLPAQFGTMNADDRRVVAFALLEKYPTLSRDKLRGMLGCSTQEASDHKAAWGIAQRRARAERSAAEAGGYLHLEPTSDMLAAESLTPAVGE